MHSDRVQQQQEVQLDGVHEKYKINNKYRNEQFTCKSSLSLSHSIDIYFTFHFASIATLYFWSM